MDMLGNQKMRQIITDHYQMSDEPRLVKRAITAARYTCNSESCFDMYMYIKINECICYALFKMCTVYKML